MTLTRDQILALPAGRELDATVAEHVMGHEIVNTTHGLPAIRDGNFAAPIPAYSTTGDGMLAVIDGMEKRECSLEVIHRRDREQVISFWDGNDCESHEASIAASSSDLPRAVAVAALLALAARGKS